MRGTLARFAVHRALDRLRSGCLELVEGARSLPFGDPASELRATVEIRDPRAYAAVLRGSTGMGEAYVDELWTSEDPVAVVRIACRNLAPFDRARRLVQPLLGPLQRTLKLVPRNTRTGAARHISAHYDLGNRLFEAFLDERLMYSCAYFDRPEASIDDAQLAKLERICERLELAPDDHLVEIGTGWGGLAIHAAATRGCRVTTTTISREQHSYAVERVHAEGLDDRVEVLFRDYRATADHLYQQEKASRTFSNKHIFPGGCLPSQALITELTATNGLATEWSEEISSHYALTLAAWRQRFNDAWPRLRPLGYDERFKRLWNFYLASSEAGFRERRIRDLQMLFAKGGELPAPGRQWSPTREPARASL
jgi:cyclopropane-fatty-acyl-phospholipid synthase